MTSCDSVMMSRDSVMKNENTALDIYRAKQNQQYLALDIYRARQNQQFVDFLNYM